LAPPNINKEKISCQEHWEQLKISKYKQKYATIEAKKRKTRIFYRKATARHSNLASEPNGFNPESCSHVLSLLFRIFVRLPVVTLQRFIASAHLIAVLVETIEIAMLSEAV
jgi:hypothetical protein